jgi:hypothetical protein
MLVDDLLFRLGSQNHVPHLLRNEGSQITSPTTPSTFHAPLLLPGSRQNANARQ